MWKDIEDRQPNGARNGGTAKGIEILHTVIERSRNLWCGHHSSQGVTIPNWLAHRHDIGYNILGLEAPEVRTDAPKAHLHFARNANAPRIAHMPVSFLHIAISATNLTPA